jgi:5-methylcytosine-specific restriction endonuclease McrA
VPTTTIPDSGQRIAPQRALPLLLARYGLTCPDCGQPMYHWSFPETLTQRAVRRQPCPRYRPDHWELDPTRAATVDHVTPRCIGGTNTWGNYEAVCMGCNLRRHGAWRRRNPNWREQIAAYRAAKQGRRS